MLYELVPNILCAYYSTEIRKWTMMIYLFPYLEMMMDKTFIYNINKQTHFDTFPDGLETSRPRRIKGNQTLPKLSVFSKRNANAKFHCQISNSTLYIKQAMFH